MNSLFHTGLRTALTTLLTLILLAPAATMAQPDFDSFGASSPPGDPVFVSAKASRTAVVPGDQFAIAVVFDHEVGWHVHPNNPVVPREMGSFQPIPTTVEFETPAGVSVGPIQWPQVYEVEVAFAGPVVMYGVYKDKAIAYIPVLVDADAAPGALTFNLKVDYQACDDRVCVLPQTERFEITLDILEDADAGDTAPANAELFRDFDMSVFDEIADWGAAASLVTFNVFGLIEFDLKATGIVGLSLLLLLAALGGLLLNMTPCVLPVIPIKIMGLSQAASNPARCFALGLTMSLGVIAFWLAIGGAIAFIAGFDAISSLFQLPWFSLVVGLFIAVMALGMFGVFGVGLPQWVYRFNPRHDTLVGSFGFGVMTAILSTPCVAPFMGAAAAWAAVQPSGITLAGFSAIGVGMALPYLILSANPKWVDRIPRTGPASELVKQVMGLLLLAVASFFFGIGLSSVLVTPPDPPSLAHWWFVGLFAVAAGIWLALRTFRITKSMPRRALFGGLGAATTLVGVALAVNMTDRGPIEWIYYTPERLAEANDSGDVVVIDFTAEWCLNCKAIEAAVLFRPEIAGLLNGAGVVPLKVDLTGGNPEGSALLKEFNWVGIPLLIIDGPGLERPILYGDGYTVPMVREAIERARG